MLSMVINCLTTSHSPPLHENKHVNLEGYNNGQIWIQNLPSLEVQFSNKISEKRSDDNGNDDKYKTNNTQKVLTIPEVILYKSWGSLGFAEDWYFFVQISILRGEHTL